MHKKIIDNIATVRWFELVIALIILGGLISINFYREYARIQTLERDRLLTQTQVIAKNLEFQLKGANQALQDVIQDLPRWEKLQGGRDASRQLAMLADAMPGIRAVSVFDAQGTLIFSNHPQFLGQNFSYREYFKTVKARPNAEALYVSLPFKGLLGNYVINVTRMIPGKKGEFAGIVTATLDPEYFKTLLTSVLYAPDVRSSLVHSDGLLFINEPELKKIEGMNLAVPGSFFTRHSESGQAATVFSGQLYATKEYRMIAQRNIQSDILKLDKTLSVGVSRDLEMIFSSWKSTVFIEAGCFVLFAIFSIATLLIFQHHQRRYERDAAKSIIALERSESLFRSIYGSSAIGMALVDLEGYFIKANQSLCDIIGYSETELCQKNFREITHPDDLEGELRLMENLLAGKCDNYLIEKRYSHQNGSAIWVQLTGSTVRNSEGKVLFFVAQIQDVTERKVLQDKLQTQAYQDYLTGLSNRRHFMERADAELARIGRYGGFLSLLMLDIDNFKIINDTHGHKVGDIALQELCKICIEVLRDVDLIGRMGGEEFAVLLPETDAESAIVIAERLRQAIGNARIALDNEGLLQFSVSIGITTLRDHKCSIEALLAKADKALYDAKKSGRNRVSYVACHIGYPPTS